MQTRRWPPSLLALAGAPGLARQGSLGLLLLLARAVTEEGPHAGQTTVELLSTALSAAFPDSPGEQAASRQLAAHEWVPVLQPAGVIAAAQQAQAHAAASAAQQAAAASSAVARQLAADLEVLCPDVTVTDLHTWALIVRVGQGSRTGVGCPLELFKSLLVNAQQLFDGLGRPGTLLGFTVSHACSAGELQPALCTSNAGAAVAWAGTPKPGGALFEEGCCVYGILPPLLCCICSRQVVRSK